jgi:3-deoxy-D-manno-octulosonic acid (KDO) 8-phosphate synthase
LLAGPNVIESEEHILRMANHLKTISTKYVSYASVNAFNFEKKMMFLWQGDWKNGQLLL